MEIVKVAQYGDNCYSDLLYQFYKFKASILQNLNCLETFIFEFIKENSEEYTFSQEIYKFVEKDLQITEFVNSLKNNIQITNNCIKSQLKKNSMLEAFSEEINNFYLQLRIEFQEKLEAVISQKLFSLESEERHPQIEVVDKATIRRSICSNGRWQIQCIKKKQNLICQSYSIKFIVEGSDIIFGIASFDKIKNKKFELTDSIPDSYFIRQDGIHFGFGRTEAEQEFSTPELTAKRNSLVLLNLRLQQQKIVLKNLTTGIVAEFQIPKIPENWCFILGLRFENERVKLEK